jgi:hypothetical protein
MRRMDKPRSFAPITAVMLLLLLMTVLYVGSYLAITYGQKSFVVDSRKGAVLTLGSGERFTGRIARYRACEEFCEVFFWPVEQIDRRLRPGVRDDHTTWDVILTRDQVVLP